MTNILLTQIKYLTDVLTSIYLKFNDKWETYYLIIKNRDIFNSHYREYIDIEHDVYAARSLSKKEVIVIIGRLQQVIEKFIQLDKDMYYNTTRKTFVLVSNALKELSTLLSNFSDDHKF